MLNLAIGEPLAMQGISSAFQLCAQVLLRTCRQLRGQPRRNSLNKGALFGERKYYEVNRASSGAVARQTYPLGHFGYGITAAPAHRARASRATAQCRGSCTRFFSAKA